MRIPTKATLRKYGLTEDDWRLLLWKCNERCAVCEAPLDNGKALAIDHEHAKGFKRMPPAEKRKHVRGVLHRMPCNRYLVAKNNAATAARVAAYLEQERPL